MIEHTTPAAKAFVDLYEANSCIFHQRKKDNNCKYYRLRFWLKILFRQELRM